MILGFFLWLSVTISLWIYTHANNDLLNQAFDEAKRYDYILNPGNDKKAVGSQLFNSSININFTDNFWKWCFRWPKGKEELVDIKSLYCKSIWWFAITKRWCFEKNSGKFISSFKKNCSSPLYIWHESNNDQCLMGNLTFRDINVDKDLKPYCQSLWYDYDIPAIQIWANEPYLIRFTKLILRITIAISISIILFAGISYILAFGDAAKQKKAINIIIYALGGIFIWLSSLAIVELALSITKSSLKF